MSVNLRFCQRCGGQVNLKTSSCIACGCNSPKGRRIGFTGPGGAGKTTVAKALGKETLDISYIPGVARPIFEKHQLKEVDQYQLSPGEVWFIQNEIFEKKVEQRVISNGIFDRTLLDHLVYCLIRCGPALSDFVVKTLEVKVKTELATYDRIFYFPEPTWKILDDKVRENTVAHRKLVAAAILGFLYEAEVSFDMVPEGISKEAAMNYFRQKLK